MKNIKSNHWGKMKVTKIFALVVLLLSFGGNSIAADYVSLRIYPEDVGVFVEDGKQQFVALGVKADGRIENITSQVGWESSNENVVTIDSNGLATIVGSVTSGRVKVSCTFPKRDSMSGAHLLLL